LSHFLTDQTEAAEEGGPIFEVSGKDLFYGELGPEGDLDVEL
jgi:hypothetical protein